MMNLKKGLVKKALTIITLGAMIFSLLFNNGTINSSAHNAYFLSITIDENNFKYTPTVVFEENDWVANNHREAEIGDFTSATVEDNTGKTKPFTVPVIKYTGDGKISEEDLKKAYEGVVKSGDGDKGLAFSFPGLHSRGFAIERRHANSTDEEMAFFVSDYLVGGFNDTLAWIANKAGGYKKITTEDMKSFSAELSNKASTVSNGGAIQTVSLQTKDGAVNFKIKKATDKKLAKLVDGKIELSDYVVIVSPDNEERYALFKINKGYQTRTDISAEYKEGLKKYKDPEYLTWQYIVLQANYSSDVNNITFSSINEIVKPGSTEIGLTSFFASILSGLRALLGLYPLEDVMLNGGARNGNYYYGVMPNGWMSSANLLNFVCQIIAWSIMGFAFVKMLFKRQLSTMNISERVSLVEGIKDILLCCLLLAGFGLVFHSMIRINYTLVDLFESSSMFSSYIGTATTMNSGFIASVLINIAFFIINCYFNVVYVLRAFTIAMLYALAPLAIVTISFGGKYKAIFSNFMKELISQIFLQSIHALCVAFFTSVTATNQMRTFELFTVLMAFIPITNFIRQNLLGLPGGITEQASGIVSMGKSLAMGAVGGMTGSARGGAGRSVSNRGANLDSGINKNISNSLSSKSPVKSDKFNSMKDSLSNTPQINNSELKGGLKDGKNPLSTNGISNHIASVNGNKADYLNAGKSLFMGIASAGASIGFGAIGDKRGMEQFASVGRDAINGARQNFESSVSSPELYDSGIKDVYSDQDTMTMVMDDLNGKFNRSDLNGTDYEANFYAMRDCFLGEGEYATDGSKASEREKALNYYKSQGINGVGRNNQGNTVVNFSKDMADNRRNFSLRDVCNIAMFDSNKGK